MAFVFDYLCECVLVYLEIFSLYSLDIQYGNNNEQQPNYTHTHLQEAIEVWTGGNGCW